MKLPQNTLAQSLFDKLKTEHVVGSQGQVSFELAGISTPANDISVIGNLVQDWLAQFMRHHHISFSTPANTQDFPDFYLSKSETTHLLEVKCFTKSPNFDIANFNAYCRSLLTDAHRLDADYLIFKYKAVEGGIEIQNIWLKKVWEIASASDRAAIKIQWKQNQAVNIRPGTWYSSATQFPCFTTRLAFVEAIEKVQNTLPNRVPNWLRQVKASYKEATGRDL
jgi:NgoBV restriction endonuclease